MRPEDLGGAHPDSESRRLPFRGRPPAMVLLGGASGTDALLYGIPDFAHDKLLTV